MVDRRWRCALWNSTESQIAQKTCKCVKASHSISWTPWPPPASRTWGTLAKSLANGCGKMNTSRACLSMFRGMSTLQTCIHLTSTLHKKLGTGNLWMLIPYGFQVYGFVWVASREIDSMVHRERKMTLSPSTIIFVQQETLLLGLL